MIKNPLLAQALAKIEASVKNQEVYRRLLEAGRTIIYDKNTFQQLSQGLAKSKTPVQDVAKGMVAVLNIMAHRARGTIPHDAFLQAGMALLLDALDFMEQAGLVKIDKRALDEATTVYIETLLPTVGLTPDKLQGALSQVQQVMNNPQQMQQFKATRGAP